MPPDWPITTYEALSQTRIGRSATWFALFVKAKCVGVLNTLAKASFVFSTIAKYFGKKSKVQTHIDVEREFFGSGQSMNTNDGETGITEVKNRKVKGLGSSVPGGLAFHTRSDKAQSTGLGKYLLMIRYLTNSHRGDSQATFLSLNFDNLQIVLQCIVY